jgi:DNA-binding HxlR family transcriptional regulator
MMSPSLTAGAVREQAAVRSMTTQLSAILALALMTISPPALCGEQFITLTQLRGNTYVVRDDYPIFDENAAVISADGGKFQAGIFGLSWRLRSRSVGDKQSRRQTWLVGGKYKLRILWVLIQRPCRYGEIRASLLKGAMGKSVTARGLSRELKDLQQRGLIHRRQYDVMPLRVEYSLTD